VAPIGSDKEGKMSDHWNEMLDKALEDPDRVTLISSNDETRAAVESRTTPGVYYLTTLRPAEDAWTCTCPWGMNHSSDRDPTRICWHVAAVALATTGADA